MLLFAGKSQLREVKDTCYGLDLTDFDVTLNTSLNVSLNKSVTCQSNITRTPNSKFGNKLKTNHSIPNALQQFARTNVEPRTPTPISNQIPKTNTLPSHPSMDMYQRPPTRQNTSLPAIDKSSVSPMRPKPLLQIRHSVDKPGNCKRVTTTTSLSQNDKNDDNLSTTVNSLLQDLDTDSIFGDF